MYVDIVGEKYSISGYLRDVNKRLTVAHFLLVIVALINQVSALAAVSNVSAENIGKLTRAVEAVEAAVENFSSLPHTIFVLLGDLT